MQNKHSWYCCLICVYIDLTTPRQSSLQVIWLCAFHFDISVCFQRSHVKVCFFCKNVFLLQLLLFLKFFFSLKFVIKIIRIYRYSGTFRTDEPGCIMRRNCLNFKFLIFNRHFSINILLTWFCRSWKIIRHVFFLFSIWQKLTELQ